VGIESYDIGDAFMASPPSTFFRATNIILGSEVIVRRLAVDATPRTSSGPSMSSNTRTLSGRSTTSTGSA